MDRRYRAICTGNALAESKEKGTPSVRLSFTTQYECNTPDEPIAKQFFADLWLSDAAFERSMDTLTNVFGWSGENLFELNVDTLKFAGIECDIVTGEEEYNGRIREKVKFVNKAGAIRAIDEIAASSLGEKMRAKLAMYRQNNKGKPVPEVSRKAVCSNAMGTMGNGNSNSNSNQDDDLPF